MIQVPAHMQDEYDALSAGQKSAFNQLVQMSAAGTPGNMIVSFAAFENAMKCVQRMGPEPDQPIEPDKSVNHDWPANFIPKRR